MNYEQQEKKIYLSPGMEIVPILGDVLVTSNDARDNQFDDDFFVE